MTHPLRLIRTRLSCALEAAAQELDHHLDADASVARAYQQGRADERHALSARLSCWRDNLPPDRRLSTLRTTLDDIIRSLKS